jgi:hypothetical protein
MPYLKITNFFIVGLLAFFLVCMFFVARESTKELRECQVNSPANAERFAQRAFRSFEPHVEYKQNSDFTVILRTGQIHTISCECAANGTCQIEN